MAASITLDGNTLAYRTPYHPGLVQALKAAIPTTDRRWDGQRKVWQVAPAHGATLATLTKQYLGEDVDVPTASADAPTIERRILDVRYLGMAKERDGSDERTAFAWVAGEWAAVFPESALKTWFGQADTQRPTDGTLYATLGVPRDASGAELRTAYRRLARTWHPDVCREPDSAETFISILRAYEVLSDPGKRGRYDAGLALAATTKAQARPVPNQYGYRAPLRCGYILAEGYEQLGRFIVMRIYAWEDVTRADGAILVSSWPAGAEAPVEDWSLV